MCYCLNVQFQGQRVNTLILYCAVLYVSSMWWTQRIASKHRRCPNTFLKNWNGSLLKKFFKYSSSITTDIFSRQMSTNYWRKDLQLLVDCFWNVMAHAQKPDFFFRAKRTSPFESAGTSFQSTTGSRGVRMRGSNAGYTMFLGSVKSIGYPFHSQVSPSLPLPYVTMCHHISTGLYLHIPTTQIFVLVIVPGLRFIHRPGTAEALMQSQAYPWSFWWTNWHWNRVLYRVIHKSLRDFRTRLRNNQDRNGRKEHINR